LDNIHGSNSAAVNIPLKRPVLWKRDFVFICIFNLILFFSFQMITLTLPVYAGSIGASSFFIGLVTASFTVTAIAVRPYTGRWLDKYGRKGLWLAGTAVYLAATAGYSFAHSISSLIALRFLHGGAYGIISTAAAASATDLIPPSRMGEGMGFFGLGVNLGMAFGPALGLFLLDRYSFTVLFFTSAALSIFALITVKIIRLPKINRQMGQPPAALLEPTAFKPTILMACATFVLGGVFNFIAIYGAEKDINNAGLYFTVYALTLVLTRPFSGMIFDRFGHRLIIIPGFLCIGAGVFILSISNDFATFLMAAMAGGLGFGSLAPALQALSVAKCAPTRRAAAQATFTASYDIGMGVGSVSLGFLAQFTGYGGMYLASAFWALASVILYLLLLGADKQYSISK